MSVVGCLLPFDKPDVAISPEPALTMELDRLVDAVNSGELTGPPTACFHDGGPDTPSSSAMPTASSYAFTARCTDAGN